MKVTLGLTDRNFKGKMGRVGPSGCDYNHLTEKYLHHDYLMKVSDIDSTSRMAKLKLFKD